MVVKHVSLLVFVVTLKHAAGLLCYSCSDLTTNLDCFNVTKCPPAELCYGRADGFLTADVKHTTGCTKELTPVKTTVSGATTFCSSACQGNLCNLGECSKGSDDRTKGPRCLSCDYVNSTDDCDNVIQCSKEEMCFVSRIKAFGQTRYRLGCMDKQYCRRKINTATILGKRSVSQKCSVCCTTDHCNLAACQKNGTTDVYQLESMSPGVDCPDTDPVLCLAMSRLNHEACKETSVVRTCPKSCDTCDHVGWGTWQSWGECSTTKPCDNTGTKTRRRTCHSRLNITKHQHCVGPSTDSTSCYKHCPVNGGWCSSFESYKCPAGGTYCYYDCTGIGAMCTRRVKTTCSCPSPAYGGRNCA